MADLIQAQLYSSNFMIDEMIKFLNVSRERLNDTYSSYHKQYSHDPEILNEICNFKLYHMCLNKFKSFLSSSCQELQLLIIEHGGINQKLMTHIENTLMKRAYYQDSNMIRTSNSSYMLSNTNESNMYVKNASKLVNSINANNVMIFNNNTNTNNNANHANNQTSFEVEVKQQQPTPPNSSQVSHSIRPAFVSSHRISSDLNESIATCLEDVVVNNDPQVIAPPIKQLTQSRTYEEIFPNVPLTSSNSCLSISNEQKPSVAVDSNLNIQTSSNLEKSQEEAVQVAAQVNNNPNHNSNSTAYSELSAPAILSLTRSQTPNETSNSVSSKINPDSVDQFKSSASEIYPKTMTEKVESMSSKEKLSDSQNNLGSSSSMLYDDRLAVVAKKRTTPMKLLNKDVYVRQSYPVMSPNIHYNCYITYIENPMLFWVHLVDDAESLSDMIASINAFYKNETNNKKFKCQMFDTFDYYAALFQGEWYRARILDIYPEEEKALVFYFDYGNYETIPFDHIRLLDKSFRCIPYFAYPLTLANAVPRAKRLEWSSNDILAFRNFGGEDELVVSVVNDLGDWPIRMCKIRRKKVSDMNKDDGLSYMKDIKRANRAEVQDVIATFKDQMLQLNQRFGFCEKYFKRNINSMVGKFAVKAFPEERVIPESELMIEKAMKKRIYLAWSDSCRKIPEKVIELDSSRQFKFQLAHYKDPNHFYINLIDKKGLYADMNKRINEFYSQNKQRLQKLSAERNYDFIATDNLCIVELESTGQSDPKRAQFQRGLFKFVPNFNSDQQKEDHIKDSADRHQLTISLIDSGKSLQLDFDAATQYCYPLMNEFASLAPRCIAATSKIVPMSQEDQQQNKWSPEAIEAFKEILSPYILFKDAAKSTSKDEDRVAEIRVKLNSIMVIKFDYGLLETRNEYIKLGLADKMITKGLAKLFIEFYDPDFESNSSTESDSESMHDVSSNLGRARVNTAGGNDSDDKADEEAEFDLSYFDKSALVLQYVMNPENSGIFKESNDDASISVQENYPEDEDQICHFPESEETQSNKPFSSDDDAILPSKSQESTRTTTTPIYEDSSIQQSSSNLQESDTPQSTLSSEDSPALQTPNLQDSPPKFNSDLVLHQSTPKTYVEDPELEEWHPQKKVFDSVANNYFYDEFSVEARIQGYETRQSKDVCQNQGFKKFGKCTNRYCNFLHETNNEEIVSRINSNRLAQSNAATYYTESIVQLGLIKNKNILIQIQSIYEQSPRLMCKALVLGFFENGTFDSFAAPMDCLFTDMQNHYSQLSKAYLPVFREGQIVAAKSNSRKKWLRGKVLSLHRPHKDIDSTTITVFFLDLGDVEELPIQNVYPIHKKFLSIPFYYCLFALIDDLTTLDKPFQFERFSHVYKQLSLEFSELIGIVEEVIDRSQNLVDLKVIGRSQITNKMVLIKDYLRQQINHPHLN